MELTYIDEACKEGVGDKRLYVIIQSLVTSINEDLEPGEVDFLTSYAFQDFKYYLMAKFNLMHKKDNEASLELCRKVLSEEDKIRDLAREWFSWWTIKWRQRVRLDFKNEVSNANINVFDPNVENIIKSIPKDKMAGLRKAVIEELIRENEVCSLDVISDFIIQSVINELVNEYGPDKAKEVLDNRIALRMRILSKIMEIKNSDQPLVILRVRLNPYQGYASW